MDVDNFKAYCDQFDRAVNELKLDKNLATLLKYPDACVDSLVNWAGEAAVERKQARQVLDATLSILFSPNNTKKQIGLNVEKDWISAMKLFKKYKGLETNKKASAFFTNEFIE